MFVHSGNTPVTCLSSCIIEEYSGNFDNKDSKIVNKEILLCRFLELRHILYYIYPWNMAMLILYKLVSMLTVLKLQGCFRKHKNDDRYLPGASFTKQLSKNLG